MKRLKVSTWALADVIAPLLALGLAIGRIGCYLNGCCWGQVAVPECQPVPLSPGLGQFPLIPAADKDSLCKPGGLESPRPHCRAVQTGTGFVVKDRLPGDPRSVVVAVEPGSQAEQAGLRVGDEIIAVDGKTNAAILILNGDLKSVETALELATNKGRLEIKKPEMDLGIFGCHRSKAEAGDWIATVVFDNNQDAKQSKEVIDKKRLNLSARITDRYVALLEDWPRGGASLNFEISRENQKIPLSMTPRTVTLFPTQIYEFISMILLIGVMLSYEPFKRHNGQLFVFWLIGYGIHRFINEAIRVEPTYKLLGIDFGLTLSQWISVGLIIIGIIIEIILRKTGQRIQYAQR